MAEPSCLCLGGGFSVLQGQEPLKVVSPAFIYEQTKAQRGRKAFGWVSCLPVAEPGLVPPVLINSTFLVTKRFGGCVMLS